MYYWRLNNMIIKVKEYESETFLPDEISDIMMKCAKNVLNVLNEEDKVFLEFGRMRGEIIRWFANNGEVIK
jgi:hypothetical protein